MQLSRVSLSARKTCSAWRGSAQKSQSPIGNCRLRCAKPAAVVNVKCSHFPIFWPLGGSIASGDRWCIVVSNIAVSFDVCDCCAMFRLSPLASLLCSPVWSLVEPDDHVFPSEILSFYLESARFEADKCSADRGGSRCFKVAFVHVVWLNVFCTIYLYPVEATLNFMFCTRRWRVKANCWDHLQRWGRPFMRPTYNYKKNWFLSKRKTPNLKNLLILSV